MRVLRHWAAAFAFVGAVLATDLSDTLSNAEASEIKDMWSSSLEHPLQDALTIMTRTLMFKKRAVSLMTQARRDAPGTADMAPVSAADQATVNAVALDFEAEAASRGEGLLSANKPVTADVDGNLNLPGIVTQEAVANWLTDRWQCARDLTGKAIPGDHWITVDLEAPAVVKSVLVDWETAYAKGFTVDGSTDNVAWKTLFSTASEWRALPWPDRLHYNVHAC
jgi:allantoicase